MKRLVVLFLAVVCLLTGCSGSEPEIIEESKESEAVPKVILDCDMTFLGDDAMCMCILAQADKLGLIELLGVTVTGGNSFVAVGTNAALRQLELIGRADIPVYMGTDEPMEGFRDLEEQAQVVGRIDKWGAMNKLDSYVAPEEYHNLGRHFERRWGYSESEPQEQSSVDFMIEQVKANSGEVTIISCGAPTNIALACEKEESFAAETAGIIYMGGILEGGGTYTPHADFNCFYDAKAFEVCLNSPFPSQTVIPHDVVGQVVLNKSVFDMLDAKPDTPISNLWLENCYALYQRDTKRKESCADAITAAVFLFPSVVQETRNCTVEINTDTATPEYGKLSVSETSDGEAVDFVLKVNTEKYWAFITDLLCNVQE